MLQRSPDASYAKAVFFEHLNDVDIFIEDTSETTKKVMSVLLGRVLGGNIRLSKIFPLGGCKEVIDVCVRDQERQGRKRVFIVDGDFSCWGCFSYRSLKRLFVLPRYCIENFLVDEAAICSVLSDEIVGMDADEIVQEFSFTRWCDENLESLVALFKAYAVARCLLPSIPTVSRAVRTFVADGSGNVEAAKVEKVVQEIASAVDERHGQGVFQAALDELGVAPRSAAPMHALSGKDYLLPLMLIRMRSIHSFKSTNASVVTRLAHRCETSGMEGVVECISA